MCVSICGYTQGLRYLLFNKILVFILVLLKGKILKDLFITINTKKKILNFFIHKYSKLGFRYSPFYGFLRVKANIIIQRFWRFFLYKISKIFLISCK